MTEGCIGLGANLGNPRRSLLAAVEGLRATRGVRVLRCSHVYRSAPVGPAGQEDYLNAAVLVATALSADDLLTALQTLEASAGRVRGERWGPRTLDLDLLLFGDTALESARLTLPHPRIRERNFVLQPLVDLLGPEYRLCGHSLDHWLRAAPQNRLARTELDLECASAPAA